MPIGVRTEAGPLTAGDSGKWRRRRQREDSMSTSLTRPQQDKVIAGVCAGLAERFGWNANMVRLLFLL